MADIAYYDPRRYAQQVAANSNPFQDDPSQQPAPPSAPSVPMPPSGDANAPPTVDLPRNPDFHPGYNPNNPPGTPSTPSPTVPGATPGTTPPPAPAGTGGANPSAFGSAWMASGGRTPADLAAFVAAHPEWGGKITGSKGDKVTFPDGSTYDAVIAAGAGGQGASWYRIDGSQGPMITPTGGVPPGVPYQPGSLGSNYDALLNKILTTPALSPDYTKRLQEMQKEQTLRGQQSQMHQQQVSAASRGVSTGGENAAVQRRILAGSQSDILNSNRDISNASELSNRAGFVQALQEALAYQRFLEGQREFGVDDQYRYAALNSSAEQAFINMILNGGA